MPFSRTFLWASAFAVLAAPAGPASASVAPQHEEDPEEPRPAPIPTGVSTGPEITYAARPPRTNSACSTRVPVCVHGEAGAVAGAPAVLATFERAWATLTGALELPPPDVDPDTLAYDVFLTSPSTLGGDLAETLLEARDVRSRVDRGRAFTLVDRRLRPGCVLDATAAAAVARAILFRAAPATEDGTARAQSTYYAGLVAPCALGLASDAAEAFQSRPDRTICDAHTPSESAVAGGWHAPRTRASTLYSEGASLVWGRIDWAFGRTPGAIPRATWALHPTMTPVGASRWINTPDTFDVLRASFKNALSRGSTLKDLMLDSGVARAFFGSADDGLHYPESRTLGDAARVPLEWDIPWPAAPRRLAPRRPVYPTGSSYLQIRTQGARSGARLRVELEWEEHSLFRWALVKLDTAGRELGRVVVPTTERAIAAQMTLAELDGVDRVLVVGVNTGDTSYAFDPDDESWEPHGWLLTVAEE